MTQSRGQERRLRVCFLPLMYLQCPFHPAICIGLCKLTVCIGLLNLLHGYNTFLVAFPSFFFSFFFQSRGLIHRWAGSSSAPKSIVHSMSAEAEQARAWTSVPTACLWCSTTWNAAKSTYFPLLSGPSEPHSCGNQLQTALDIGLDS